ncbi:MULTISPECIES: hypothetical protein [Methylococcus]|nr:MULTISPECIES: hypothetical protein [Methylococcus]
MTAGACTEQAVAPGGPARSHHMGRKEGRPRVHRGGPAAYAVSPEALAKA